MFDASRTRDYLTADSGFEAGLHANNPLRIITCQKKTRSRAARFCLKMFPDQRIVTACITLSYSKKTTNSE